MGASADTRRVRLPATPAVGLRRESLLRRAAPFGVDGADWERQADRIATAAAGLVADRDAPQPAAPPSAEPLAPELRGRLEPLFGWDLGAIRIHADDAADRRTRSAGARALTSGRDVFFSAGGFAPHTRAGLRLLAHELAHARQQSAGDVRWGTVQKKEDWNFTRADYQTLLKAKKNLTFAKDSDWLPRALQDNLLTTLRFTLTSTKPVRTEGVNVKDFYHGHFVVPKSKATVGLKEQTARFEKRAEAVEGKALGGEYFDDVTKKNLPAYTKAMGKTEAMAAPLLYDALKIEGAAVIYHTFEGSGPSMNVGSPTRNIRTPIGGTPAGYDPTGKELDANAYLDEYQQVLQFAFLVDETGVIHVTVGTTQNLSRVTGTPMR